MAPSEELLRHLSHANRWFRRQAALEIGWRGLSDLVPSLKDKARSQDDPYALDALFALDMLDAVGPLLANELLQHPDPYIRRWVVKLIGERGESWNQCAQALAALAKTELHLEVRAQLLATSKRLSPEMGLPLLNASLLPMSTEETHLPLLAWWALESKCGAGREAVLKFLKETPSVLESSVAKDFLIKRLAQRMASGRNQVDLVFCDRLFEVLTTDAIRNNFLSGVAAAFEGGEIPVMPEKLKVAFNVYMRTQNEGQVVAALRSGGDKDTVKDALRRLNDSTAPTLERIALVEALADGAHQDAVQIFLAIVGNAATPEGLKRAVLNGLARFSDESIARSVITGYEAKIAGNKEVRETALRLLSSRKDWALLLVEAVDVWKIPSKHLTPEILTLLQQHQDSALNESMKRHWPGIVGAQSMEDKNADASRIRRVLLSDVGNAVSGRSHFQTRCAACHTLFGEGGNVGPDLTGYERGNVAFWADNIIYPSLEIREGYASYTARMRNGQLIVGMMDAQTSAGVVLRDFAGQKTLLRQSEIESLDANPVSVMPEGLLGGMSDEELRDLFAFLMAPTKP
jgi:putative heme-binding domain-containing protein